MSVPKILGYVVRQTKGRPQLLAFRSLDGSGFEVIRGHVEPGETLPTAVYREIAEESGLTDVRITKMLGLVHWHDEEQTFFLCEAPGRYADSFAHEVSGHGEDEGFIYEFCWLELTEALHAQLLFGGAAFVNELLAHFES